MQMYKDYIIARHPVSNIRMLCYAPAWSGIGAGDDITLEGHIRPFNVELCYTLANDNEGLALLLTYNEDVNIQRVTAKVKYNQFRYEEDKQ